MKERPILYNGEMVRAILHDWKTQTRRLVKGTALDWLENAKFDPEFVCHPDNAMCPFGNVGDRLWVRETWGVGTRPHPFDGWIDGVEYRADEHFLDEYEDLPLNTDVPDNVDLDDYRGKWRPSIHMPRWASRITLEITGVRVERLNQISKADAMAEGICDLSVADSILFGLPGHELFAQHPIRAFCLLWQSINGPESWDANPWVWVIEFKRIEQ